MKKIPKTDKVGAHVGLYEYWHACILIHMYTHTHTYIHTYIDRHFGILVCVIFVGIHLVF